jgi:endonuclease/exonuclease/phosphatase (EEP) superfamily protein YafD
MTKGNIIGWVIELAGSALWIYGYFVTGHRAIIDWHSSAPWWMVLVFAGMVPMYWPARRE